MKMPINVIELEAIDGSHAEVRLRTSPEGARFLARFMAGETDLSKFVEVAEIVETVSATGVVVPDLGVPSQP